MRETRSASQMCDQAGKAADGAYSPHLTVQCRRDTIRTSAPRRTTGSVQGQTDGGAEPDAAPAYALCTTPPTAVGCWVPCLRRVPTPVARRASRLAYAVTLDQSGVGRARLAAVRTARLVPWHLTAVESGIGRRVKVNRAIAARVRCRPPSPSNGHVDGDSVGRRRSRSMSCA